MTLTLMPYLVKTQLRKNNWLSNFVTDNYPQERQQVRFHIYSSQEDYIELGNPHKKNGSDSENDNRTTNDLRELEDKNKNYNFNSNDEEITTSEGNNADNNHEKEDNNGDDKTTDHETANENNNTLSAAIIKIQHYILRHLQLLFDVSKSFTSPYHLQYKADAIAKGVHSFHDHTIINDTDLKALFSENSIEKNN